MEVLNHVFIGGDIQVKFVSKILTAKEKYWPADIYELCWATRNDVANQSLPAGLGFDNPGGKRFLW